MAKTTIADLQKWPSNTKFSATKLNGKNITRGGKRFNAGMAAYLDAMNVILQNSPYYGQEKEDMTVVQGSYSGAAASAGTHNGGAAVDLTPFNWTNRSWVGRILGGFMSKRPYIKGVWNDHIHGILCGDGTASPSAQRQVQSYYNGRNGLANNGKDADKRPKTLPILFVAPWDSRGKPGVYYLTEDVTARDQPTTSGKSLGGIDKGSKFTVAAVVNVKGTLWAINIHGKCVLKSSLTTKKPNPIKTEPFDAWWRVTKNGKWGLDGPNGKNRYERAAGYKLHTVEKAIVDGKPWYITSHGTWYDAQHLVVWIDQEQPEPDPEPEPEPVPDSRVYLVRAQGGLYGLAKPGSGNEKKTIRKDGSTFTAKARIKLANGETWVQGTDNYWSSAKYLLLNSVNLNTGTINVIRWRLGKTNPRGVGTFKEGLDYKDRLPGFAQMRKDMGVSILTTSESGQYADADALSKAFGDNWKNILHGDNAGDLTSAVHWDATKRKMLEEGKYTTKGSHHNWATWVLLQDIESEVIFQNNATHLEYRARGNKTATEWDKLRGEQAKIWAAKGIDLAEAAAKKYGVKTVPIIFSGDMNQDDDDNFDIVGDEMFKAGYADAEKLALSKTGPDTTYPNLPGYPPSHRRLDRIFVPIGSYVGWMRTIVGPPYTDHNGVSINVTLSNG